MKTDGLKQGTAKSMKDLEDKEKQWDKLKAGKTNKDFDQNIKDIKSKLIPKKDTIVMFDEEHESDPEYQKMKEQAVALGYNVIRMTATFKGKQKNPETGKMEPIPFSITTSYPRVIQRINKINIPDEDLKRGKTLLFFKEAKLTQEQMNVLDDVENKGTDQWNPVFYAVFDETTLGSSTGITKGAPPGSAFITDRRMSMGYSPWIDIVILLNRMVTSSLGSPKTSGTAKTQSAWDYGDPEEQGSPIADILQEAGRVARLDTQTGVMPTVLILNNFKREEDENGKLVDVTEEIDMSKKKDLASKLVEACLSGKTGIIKAQLAKFNDANFLRATIALPYK